MINKTEVPILYLYNTIEEASNKCLIDNNTDLTCKIIKKFQDIQREINEILSVKPSVNSIKLSNVNCEKLITVSELFSKFITYPSNILLDEIKKYNNKEIASIIPSTEINLQFEKAKKAALQSNSFISEHIQNYGIKDEGKLFEIAKITAAKNGRNTSNYIQNYDIKDQQKLFEIAKIAAAQSGIGISMYIQNYGIKDQQMLIEIAKIAAKNGSGISLYIHKYGIKDEEKLFEIAKIAAAQNGEGSSQNIRNFGIKDQQRLFEIAKIAASQNGGGSSKYIQNFGIKDEEMLFEIAKIAATEDGWGVSRQIQNYGIKNQQELFEIAKIAALDLRGISQFIKLYGIKDEDKLFEIAKIASVGMDTSRDIQNYGIKDQQKLFEIAKLAAAFETDLGTSEYIENYGIKDEEKLFEIAKIAAAKSGHRTSEFIKKYGIKDEERLFEIAKIAAAQDGYGMSWHIQNYIIKDQKKLIEIAKIALLQTIDVVDPNHSHVPSEICGIAIKDLVLSPLISKIGRNLFNSPGETLTTFEKFKLGTLGNLIEQNSSESEINEQAIRKRTLIHKWLGYYLLKEQVWEASIASGSEKNVKGQPVEDSFHSLSFRNKLAIDLMNKSLQGKLDKRDLQVAKKLKIIEIYPLLKAISKLRNPLMRYNLTKLLFKQLFYAETLGSLEVYRQLTDKSNSQISMGTTDRSIFALLLTPLIYQNNEDLDYTNCSQLFKEWEVVFSTLKESVYKDATMQMPIITSLYSLIKEPYLSLQEKGSLVRAIFFLGKSDKSSKEKAFIINRNLRFLEAIIFSNNANALKRLVSQIKEDNLPSKDSLAECMQEIFKGIIGEVEVKEFAEKFEKTILSSRQPQAFFTYVSKLQSLPELERKMMLPHIKDLFIDVLEGNHHRNRYKSYADGDHLKTVFSWKSDKTERKAWKKHWRSGSCSALTISDKGQGGEQTVNVVSFLKEKICVDRHIPHQEYSTLVQVLQNPLEASQRLGEIKERLIKEKESDERKKDLLQMELITLITTNTKEGKEASLKTSVELMQQIFPGQNDHPFLKDLKDLQIIMEAKTRSGESWIVEDSDNWEDLLLCGTEVLGSCQSVNGTPDLNKCLMNYLLDGKNRVVVVKDAEGHIQARVIIRLLWDAKLKRPVLYQERLYKAAGIPEECIQGLEELCISKARSLGIFLIKTPEENDKKSSTYPNALESLNGRAPFEYVDALQGKTNGCFSITCKESSVLYDPNEEIIWV